MHDVGVLDDVGFAFGAVQALRLGFLLRVAASDEVVVADHVGADELLAQVLVDAAGGFDRLDSPPGSTTCGTRPRQP